MSCCLCVFLCCLLIDRCECMFESEAGFLFCKKNVVVICCFNFILYLDIFYSNNFYINLRVCFNRVFGFTILIIFDLM